MSISPDYRRFDTFEEYDRFFQEVKATGRPQVTMFVPQTMKSDRKSLAETYVGHSERDFKVSEYIFDNAECDGRWFIAPVPNLQEYRDNTDRASYRTTIRKALIPTYRKFMTEDGVFMPISVFDLDRELWASGRHRCEAAKGHFGALYSVVTHGFSDSELLDIIDVTNQWHQEKWDADEAALLAWKHVLIGGMTERQSLIDQGLNPDDTALFLGARLYFHHNQGPLDRRLLEPRVTVKQLGENVKLFGGVLAIEWTPLDRWLFINVDREAKQVLARLRDPRASRHEVGSANRTWSLSGTPKERWEQFSEYLREMREDKASRQSKVNGPTDDMIWMNYVSKFERMSDVGLTSIKRELTAIDFRRSKGLVEKLCRIYSIEGEM